MWKTALWKPMESACDAGSEGFRFRCNTDGCHKTSHILVFFRNQLNRVGWVERHEPKTPCITLRFRSLIPLEFSRT